jgi:N-acyl-D-amino-acid deacylase
MIPNPLVPLRRGAPCPSARSRRRAPGLLAPLLLVPLLHVLGACSAIPPPGGGSGRAPEPPARPVDLVLADGLLIDGSGAPPVRGDLVVDDGRIVALGPDAAAGFAPGVRIDASGRVVAPGFVDPHAHGDPRDTPLFANFLAMGVTTVVLGQDGSSPDVPDLGAYLDAVDEAGTGPNVAYFVGHGTLRDQAGIGRRAEYTELELRDLRRRLNMALDHAFGLSTGLEYSPGLYAGDPELLALARVVGARDRLIMSHVRDEDDDALEASLDELLRQGAHARVHVAHLKSVYGTGSARAREILDHLAAARARGVTVTADLYPYTASYTGLSLLFPEWAKTREQLDAVKDARREELLTHLRNRVNGRNGPEATLLGTPPHAGKTLAELAEELGKPFEVVLLDDLGPDGGSAAYFIMDETLQETLLRDPRVAVCSDGSPTGFHPRGHGTFARIVETFVRERGVLELPEAIRRMTSLPAELVPLPGRGRLAPGFAADVVVFDPEAVHETATYEDPHRLAEGFDLVLVNGAVAWRDGAATGIRPGRVLRPDDLVSRTRRSARPRATRDRAGSAAGP